MGLAGLAAGAGCAFPPYWQWRGSQINPLQLRGQPRLGPRSLLSFDRGRRTSKVQGYAVHEDGSIEKRSRLGLTAIPRPCSPTHLVSGALYRVKRETGKSCIHDQSGAAPATVSERSVTATVLLAWEGDAFQVSKEPPRKPGDRPEPSDNKPAVGGRCSEPCGPGSRGFHALVSPCHSKGTCHVDHQQHLTHRQH